MLYEIKNGRQFLAKHFKKRNVKKSNSKQ